MATRAPMNKLPDLVGEIARLLRWEQVQWGSRRIAQVLARLGLKASRTSVQRILRSKPRRLAKKTPIQRVKRSGLQCRRVNDLWFADFTTVKLFSGLVKVRIGAVLDGFSRKLLAVGVCRKEPDADWACRLARRAMAMTGARPRTFIDIVRCKYRFSACG